ncbi:DUF222 domain-containing protein [Actinomycetospora aeridis]|uniref:DUF222 domain-containing protein n=1 Tax=Actinomycetospora aeridis TaxID=3129231 RepID=A0ABU8NDI2_9PSEU
MINRPQGMRFVPVAELAETRRKNLVGVVRNRLGLSGVGARFEHMGERVGGVEREVLDRADAAVRAHRRGYYQRLEAIAELDESGVAARAGYRTTHGLIADRDHLGQTEAKRLVAEAQDVCPRRSMAGEPLPARLPATGDALQAGLIDPGHVKIIRETMRKLAGLAGLSGRSGVAAPSLPDLVVIEASLAQAAQAMAPHMLDKLAKQIIDRCDPDGAAPPEGGASRDELLVVRRRDGSLVLKGAMHDPMDAEAFVNVIAVLSAPAGAEDQRPLARRQMEALHELVRDACRPHGLATEAGGGQADTTADAEAAASEPAAADDSGESDSGESNAGESNAGESNAGENDSGESDSGDASGASDSGERESAGPGAEAAGDAVGGDEPWALIPEPRRPGGSAPAPAKRGWLWGPGRALLTVTIDHRWLCEALAEQNGGFGTLDSGYAVDAATVRRWACDAEIVPVVLGSKSEPLDVGRRQRTATDAIRRALHLRDGGCAFPGCDRTPRRCEAHHVREWYRHRGDTALENMVLLCRYHHQLLHHRHWTMEMIDGRPWFTPPWIVDTEQTPRPGGRPHVPL